MIRRLAETDDPSGFSCGAPQLDHYLRHHALENMRAGRSVTYTWADQNGAIAGYVTLAGGAIRGADAGLARAPRYPLPVLLVARLAVDATAQRKGLGRKLLCFACEEAVIAYSRTGCVGIVVDAKPQAVGFYKRLGFQHVIESRGEVAVRMFIDIGTVIDALG